MSSHDSLGILASVHCQAHQHIHSDGEEEGGATDRSCARSSAISSLSLITRASACGSILRIVSSALH